MVKSKGWNWNLLKENESNIWKNPSVESYYLVDRWKSQNKVEFLDLGCGLGRHSLLFGKNGFHVSCFDISESAINQTKKNALNMNLNFTYTIGDMLKLPYQDETFDCILAYNVISHTDTTGVKQIIEDIKRVLKEGGECYLTLCSKDTWGFKQESWPLIDSNTRLRMESGPEYKVPHFYADYELIKQLFKSFNIIFIKHIEEIFEKDDNLFKSYHYHILMQKK